MRMVIGFLMFGAIFFFAGVAATLAWVTKDLEGVF